MLECYNIQLLFYSSACYANLALVSIFSYLYIYLCGSFSLFLLFGFTLLFYYVKNVFDYDHCYPIFCEDKTVSIDTFSPLVVSSTC